MSTAPSGWGTPPPDPLYKYAKREDADRMMVHGSFRIGTLYDFRNEEKHGAEIGDAGEGTKRVTQTGVTGTWDEVRKSPVVSSAIFAPPGANIKIVGTTFYQDANSEDVYVFCVSKEATKELLSAFRKDVCIRIDTPIMFFRALATCLLRDGTIARQNGGWLLGPCVYTEREMEYGSENPSQIALLKPPRFAREKEYRTIWPAPSLPIKPVIVRCEEAAKYLEIQPL